MSTPSIYGHLLPSLVDPGQLAAQTVVVADILRATTTIVQAFDAGVKMVHPCLEVKEAFRLAEEIGPSAVLGGERHGVRIDGFKLGNSPTEYTADVLDQRVLVITTTNGTRALRHCHLAGRVLVGSFTNLTELVTRIGTVSDLHVLCAGTDGVISREDVLFAGALVHHLGKTDARLEAGNDSARLALAAWQSVSRDRLSREFRHTLGGQNLIKIGLELDLDFAAQIGSTTRVPEFVPAENSIRLT